MPGDSHGGPEGGGRVGVWACGCVEARVKGDGPKERDLVGQIKFWEPARTKRAVGEISDFMKELEFWKGNRRARV